MRRLRVFLCHSSSDKPRVTSLYDQLLHDGFDPWLDQKKLRGGQDWKLEIERAVRRTDAVLVCLSQSSITKEGFVQKEIRLALDVADEKPEGSIFLIPVKLEQCRVPDRLSRWQWIDFCHEHGYIELKSALAERENALRANEIGIGHYDPDNPQAPVSSPERPSIKPIAGRSRRLSPRRVAQILVAAVIMSGLGWGAWSILSSSHGGLPQSQSNTDTTSPSKMQGRSLAYKIYGFQDGVLIGIVTDESGRPVGEAAVHVAGLIANAMTDEAGLFKLYLPNSYMPGSILTLKQKSGYSSAEQNVIIPSERVRPPH